MTASTADRIEEIHEQLKNLDGRSADAKALKEELSGYGQENPAGKPERKSQGRTLRPTDLVGTGADEVAGQRTAFYWCGTFPVGSSPDLSDPTGMATVDDPAVRSYPPFFTTIIAGMSFPQYIEPISRRGGSSGEQERSKLFGEIHQLREDQVERIGAEMPLDYVKWHHRSRTVEDQDGNRRSVQIPYGQMVKLRSDTYVREATEDAKANRRTPQINQEIITPGMTPIANHVYMVKVDGPNGRLPDFPQPVSELGIELP